MFGDRRRGYDYDYRGRSLDCDSPGLSSLMSDTDTSLSQYRASSINTASTSSTRTRLLEGRWRTMDDSENGDRGFQDYVAPAFMASRHRSRSRRLGGYGHRSRQNRSWAWGSSARSASPSIRDRFSDTDRYSDTRERFKDFGRERYRFSDLGRKDMMFDTDRESLFSDTSSVSTFRDSKQYQDSEADTLRSCDTRSVSSFSSVSRWSAPGYRRSRARERQQFRDSSIGSLGRARSFQTLRPSELEFCDREEPCNEFRSIDYKSTSAQDFRKELLREQRLAMGTDEEKLTDLSNDNIESDIGRNTDFDNEESFQGSPTKEKLFIERFSSPTISIPGSSLSSVQPRPEPGPSIEQILAMKRIADNSKTNQEQLSKEVDDELMKLLRNSQAHNAKLKIELKALESMLESAKFQLKSTQDRVREENADYEEDKKEDAAAAKKLAEIEEELKILSFSENLTDQALGQLKVDNQTLRDERSSLLQVLYKLSKVI